MNAIEILRAASRSVPNEDYVQFCAAVEAVEAVVEAAKDVEWNARMTAPGDTYHEVGRKEMSRLTAALKAVRRSS